MNDRSDTWTLRADLKVQRIEMGEEPFWVLQDPLSRQMHYVNAREYGLLKLLDGRRGLADLVRETRHRFAPDHLSADALVFFLADAHRRGLITGGNVSDSSQVRQPAGETSRPSRSWWKQPLAIRLPGINPDPIIDPVASRIGWLFCPFPAMCLLALCCVAIAMVVSQFDLLSDHIVEASRGKSQSWVLTLAFVIGLTKIAHELAHAVTCKAFGAECREIGVMFLVGIPCLYCDVSDAWMLPQRWKRIMVSAAGMAAEIALASVATILWWFSAEGVVRDVCVTVMIVCSVSTLMFNGNPLLRYDGYYILSDLVGIPNLATRARAALRASFQSLLRGVPDSITRTNESAAIDGHNTNPSRRGFLLSYAMASGAYRLIVYAIIAYVIYRFAEGFGLGKAAAVLAVTMAVVAVAKAVTGLLKPPKTGVFLRSSRPLIITSAGILLILGVLLAPLRRSVIAPAMICPAQPREVYATVGGRIVQTVRYGTQVQRGDVIARLENPDEQQELLRLQAECERLRIEIDVLQGRRGSDVIAATRLPAVKEALRSAERQLEMQHRQVQRLALHAPIAGRVFAGDRLQSDSLFTDRPSDPRSTLPLSPDQHGGWIEAGKEVCIVGAEGRRDVLLWVRQQDIPLIQVGQSIELLLPEYFHETATAAVTEIASEPVDTVDRELVVSGLVELEPGADHERRPRGTMYQVRASLGTSAADLPSRLTARAQINVAAASLLERATRWLHDMFRFRS